MHHLFLLVSTSGTDLSDCICPPRCTNLVHEAAVSSSRLSDMMTSDYVSQGNNDSETERRYVNAAETRSRVALSLITDIIGHLETLVTAYQRLKAMLAIDLVEHTTSVPGQIYASINTIVQQTQDSLAEFSSQISDKFTDYYKQNVDYAVTRLVETAKSILSRQFYLDNANGANSSEISHIERLVVSTGKIFCEDAHVVIDAISNGDSFSTTLSVDRTCEDEDNYEFCMFIDDFMALIRNNGNFTEKLLDLYEKMIVSAKTVLKCAPMYGTFLTEVQSWLKLGLTMNSSLPLQPADSQYILGELDDELQKLKDISRMFAEKSEVSSFVYYHVYFKFLRQIIVQEIRVLWQTARCPVN